MHCKYLNLRNNEELAQITMRKRNSTLNQSTPNCPGLWTIASWADDDHNGVVVIADARQA